MASSRFLVGSSFFPSPLSQNPKPRKTLLFHHSYPSISCQFASHDDDDDDKNGANNPRLNFLKLSVTLTVISTSLSQSAAVAAPAKTAGKKRAPKKPQEALTLEQLKAWSQGLPVVSNRIPYTELLTLKAECKLKHVIKPPGVDFWEKSEPVLVVLEDSTVLRTVLPSVAGNGKFWKSWDEWGMESLCVSAYTPPVKKAELPPSYLGFLKSVKAPAFVLPWMKQTSSKKRSKKSEEFRKKVQLRKERELAEKRREQKALKAQQKEEARKKEEAKKERDKELRLEKIMRVQRQSEMWNRLATDNTVTTCLGIVFFYLFYQIVVLGYKKQNKDYDDRLKIEQAEEEERKKMQELELEMHENLGEEEEVELGDGRGGLQTPVKQAAKFLKSGARVRRGLDKRLPKYMYTGGDEVTFADVAGLGKIRIELEEIVKFFTHGDVYRRRGVKIPGGILLCGSPGVGKTLLAKAVAAEAGVNFFSISASQFVEIYVGVGASRVRALYEEAKTHAPAVVFIDELDAVGRSRGLIKGSGGRERDATLNQLLVCLDGFEGKGEVITIASTNRPDILDPALVRPGRFDRKIRIPKPGRIGRVEILKVHARKKPMAPNVDYEVVADMTDGMVGAELANVVEVAAINMIREGRKQITTDDLIQAAQVEERGLLDKKDRTPKMWKQIAINEAALAVVAANFPVLNNIEFITIAPRAGKELGYVRCKMDHIKFRNGMLSRQCLLDHITVQLAPRAADEIWYGEGKLSTIWAVTADNARSAARAFVLGGLSEKHHGLSNFWMQDRINEIDLEAMRIVNSCYERAKEILQRNQKLMEAMVDQLVEKKSVTKEEFLGLIELHGSLEPLPPGMVDVRKNKLLQLQEMMTKQEEAAVSRNA